MPYQHIQDALQAKRATLFKRDADAARTFFDGDLSRVDAGRRFQYKKTGKLKTYTGDKEIAFRWRKLLEEDKEIRERWAEMCADSESGSVGP